MSKKQKNYSVDNKNRIVYADILALTETEVAEVMKYTKFGFTVDDKKPKEKSNVKRLNDSFIRGYLTKEDEDALKTYEDKKHEKKENKEDAREKGFPAGKYWFSITYPKNIDDIKWPDNTKPDIKYDDYVSKKSRADKKAKDNNRSTSEVMTEEQYTRYYYWTKFFEQK